MTHKLITMDGLYKRVLRDDAVSHGSRWIVPTTTKTKWVDTWDKFHGVGGTTSFSEDQTEITLLLPEGYKFSCKFPREVAP